MIEIISFNLIMIFLGFLAGYNYCRQQLYKIAEQKPIAHEDMTWIFGDKP